MNNVVRNLAAAVASAVVTCGSASAADVTIAGGKLDPKYPQADIYLEKPAAAVAPQTAACQMARRYIETIQAGRYNEVVDLFADDASLLEPTRQNALGRAAINAFYTKTIGPMKPELVPVAFVGGETDCMLVNTNTREIDGQKRWRLASVNHFTLNAAGKISRMVAFVRP